MDTAIDVAVIPVAGLGTRLLPATKSQPKEMLPVGRKPVVQYVVEELARVGMQRVLFITGFSYTSELGRGGALDPGMEIMRKPFTLTAFATKVNELIALASA